MLLLETFTVNAANNEITVIAHITVPVNIQYKGTIQEYVTLGGVRIKRNKVALLAATVLQRRGTLYSVSGTAPLLYTGQEQK